MPPPHFSSEVHYFKFNSAAGKFPPYYKCSEILSEEAKRRIPDLHVTDKVPSHPHKKPIRIITLPSVNKESYM